MKLVALIYSAQWLATSIAVSTAVYVTGSGKYLWFFLIQALFGVAYKQDGDEK